MKKTISIDEFLYYLMILFFLGSKAIGLSEGQWPFSLALIIGFSIAVLKIMITKNSIIEWILIIFLFMIGGYIVYSNGHIEVLVNLALLIGMKNVELNRVIKLALTIFGGLFVLTVIRALLGFYPGYIAWQTKVGFGYGLFRYSLGFTHPNVLHVTFFVCASLMLLCSSSTGKRRKLLRVGLLLANLYFFIYSVSYTGLIVTLLLIILDIIFSSKKKWLWIEKVILILTSICFLFPLIGQSVLSGKVADYINSIINQRLRMAHDVFSVISPSLFGSNVEVSSLGMNLDSSYSYAVHYHGIIIFLFFVIGYLMTMSSLFKQGRKKEFAIMFAIAVSGITEQYISNLSCKNISLFFIGDYLFNTYFVNIKTSSLTKKISLVTCGCRGIGVGWVHNLKNKINWYFGGTNYIKCVFPALLVGGVACFLFVNSWIIPSHIYLVSSNLKKEDNFFVYSEDMYEELEISDSLVVGKLANGVKVARADWINPIIEYYRGVASSLLWGTFLGFLLFSFLLNLKKLNTVCIETPISEGNVSRMPSCSILGTNIAVTNMKNAVDFLTLNIDDLSGKYICVSNVHTTVMASQNEKYRNIQNGAVIALPDGKPLSYVSRKRGYIQADRVAGPDLMTEIFAISSEKGYRHFFFGSSEETLKKLEDNLTKRYPGINIVGMLSPKYYQKIDEMPEEENEKYIQKINSSKADFVWIGLGAPKQEQWMAMNEGKVHGVMIGVGAGFDFHAGTIKRAPKLLQGLYLEWLYRLLQDPKRLFKRYISTNFKFVKDTFVENKKMRKGVIASNKPRLLIYAHYYYPDVASTGQILTELAEGLSSTFEVTVISVVPSYNGMIDDKYKIYRYYQQNVRGVQVVRVRVPEFAKTSKISRVWNIMGYFIRARRVTNKIGKQDIVFSISQPPILGGMLGVYGKKRKNAKFVYNIQDFNPEQIQSVKYSNNQLLIWFLKKFDMRSCKKADLIVTVGCDLAQTIENRFTNKQAPPYTVINNWINEEEIYPLDDTNDEVDSFMQKYGLKDKFVFMYSGNLGLYYDLPALFEVICSLPKEIKASDGREVIFAFVGNGGLKEKLEKFAIEHETNNVIFIPYQDKERLVYSLNAGDVHICMNAKGIKGVSCPSKYYGIAAIGKPVLASLEKDTEIRNIIEKTDSGLVSSPGDNEALRNNILEYIHNITKEDASMMGRRGRDNLLNNLTKKTSVDKYRKELLELLR